MTTHGRQFAALGECMIEISDLGDGRAERRFGGDTLNTAVYLARLGAASGLTVRYLTALGDDPWSEEMLGQWRHEGIDTDLVLRLPGGLPGLYMIRTDEAGERSFHYWRERAAARQFWQSCDPVRVAAALAACDLIYLSGISLSILLPEDRAKLFDSLTAARAAGARIVFDGNYRPRGWPGPADARAAFETMLALTDIALPTFEDEAALFGDRTVEDTCARLAAAGVAELAVKQGSAGVTLQHGEGREHVEAMRIAEVVDTTAAGDSFNAGYLAARLAASPPAEAAAAGHRLAARVIGYRGAVIPRTAMP